MTASPFEESRRSEPRSVNESNAMERSCGPVVALSAPHGNPSDPVADEGNKCVRKRLGGIDGALDHGRQSPGVPIVGVSSLTLIVSEIPSPGRHRHRSSHSRP